VTTARPLRTLAEAIDFTLDTLAAHPERDALAAEAAAWAGRPRPHACFHLNHLYVPDDHAPAPALFELPPHTFADDPEGRLAGEILGHLTPLDMLNPVATVLGTGAVGTPAEFIPSFGTPLSEDRGAAAFTRSLDELLAAPPPDPDAAPPLPDIHRRIAFLKASTPEAFKLDMPNLQGPFNLAHALAGDEAFLAPLTDPGKYDRLMTRITDFWIAACERLRAWIGPDRLRPAERGGPLIAECSVNLVSADFYREHIRRYDERIARRFGAARIHPCSGRHVFEATLDGLPGVTATEAGLMRSPMAAPCISVGDALARFGGRPVVLNIGQELPADFEEAYAIVHADFRQARANPRLLFSYTGMDWRRQDRPRIRALHQRLDEAWAGGG